MSRRHQQKQLQRRSKLQREQTRVKNKLLFLELVRWFVVGSELINKDDFHGNVKWDPEELAAQALIWSWQESKYVTNAFEVTKEICDDLSLKHVAKSYTSMMNALDRYHDLFGSCLRERFQALAEEVGDRYFETDNWTLIGFDGSRATAPRSVSNEQAFCAPNYGKGSHAKYAKKKSRGRQRKRNLENPPHPPAPQAWITMMWHMGLRLPWTWRLGPSNSSERDHIQEILGEETFPENTLFCGDAGFVGYPLWGAIRTAQRHFLVRVGANVHLLSEQANIKRLGGGIVLCWPKGRIKSGDPPIRLRLVQVKIGKTKMWLLTSVLDPEKLTKKQMIRYYKMRWGIEVEFRGLKQTIDKSKLRCRNSKRLLVELDWSIRAMAVAELLALREQIPAHSRKKNNASPDYTPEDLSLANTMRALHKCMRNLNKYSDPKEAGVRFELARALVQQYNNRTDKRARYRPKNPDKKPLGDPNLRKINAKERQSLENNKKLAA